MILAMESLAVKHMISAANIKFPVRYTINPLYTRRIDTRLRQFRLAIYSRKWDFQDFQGYAKPKRLLPASEVQICKAHLVEQIIDSFKKQTSECLYKVRLQTSGMYGSGLTDMNAGVLLCLVDENSDSILQRIPACLNKGYVMQSQDSANPEILHFQRGNIDEFIFEGPTLGKITAVWISLESGQWRLGDLSLTIIHQQQSQSAESDETHMQYIGSEYQFEFEDVMLGEGTDVPMVELRPSSVTNFSEEDIAFSNIKASEPSPLTTYNISSEESLKEYADLKFSLLFYDLILILAGSLIDSFLAGENAAFAFLTGGVGGFLYLLLLQRSVDGLPPPELVSSNNEKQNLGKIFGKFKGSASSLVLAFAFVIIAGKYISGNASGVVLTPKEVISGMLGFLMCKVSVVLAAIKPMPIGLRQNK
ncbi:hypothetical protein M9H77_06071 [Catharanthus roseus]|uniref:Uncharacterized protein n=1 Tax=Catharanthus roseus TaxID=4058 RepID=A0ACC0BR17_CATRO|nr:hypothetical protein M9H77_06071 [Catharanthus roseus]